MAIKTIVLVHGAFADGTCWAKVIPILTKRGLKAIAVQNPLSSLADDVTATHRVIGMQAEPVLLVGHSWGGAVISEAGNHAQVKGLVYVAAGAHRQRPVVRRLVERLHASPRGRRDQAPWRRLCGRRAQAFRAGIPAEEANIVYATQGPLAAGCFSDKVLETAWRSKPSWYLVAAQDETIPPAVQRDSADRMGAETLVLQSSHVPMLSQPEAVAEFIASAAASIDG